jgi:hypothetical protein
MLSLYQTHLQSLWDLNTSQILSSFPFLDHAVMDVSNILLPHLSSLQLRVFDHRNLVVAGGLQDYNPFHCFRET